MACGRISASVLCGKSLPRNGEGAPVAAAIEATAPKPGLSRPFETKMREPDARIYLSRHLMRLFGKRLHPLMASAMVGHMLLCATLMERWVPHLRLRTLAPHPTAAEPPWEHQETLLRTWPELLAIGEPYGL